MATLKNKQEIKFMGRINAGCTSGFSIGPLLFNIYLNDLFLLVECTEVRNFGDGTTFLHVKRT